MVIWNKLKQNVARKKEVKKMEQMTMTLKQHRLVRELSLAKMAELLGVHMNTYIKWEKEPWKISIEVAEKICDILGISFDVIIFLPVDTTNCCK